MAFDLSGSWNPANDRSQAPWGSYTQRFAGTKYGDLSKNFNPSGDVTTGQGSGTQSSNDLTLIYNQPSQVMQGGENPWNKVLGAVGSIAMGALSGGFGGGGSGGGAGGVGANFNPAGAGDTGISWGDAFNYQYHA